jgi:gamma-glutamyl-gamma-aminobutyrate hydrolase PuuD
MAKRVGLTYSAGRLDKAAPYRSALEFAGLEVVDNPSSIQGLGGLLLGGGVDVNPILYGEDRHTETQPPEPDRDHLEFHLLKLALDSDLPVLGICRGAQVLNVGFCGSLIQHIETGAHKSDLHPVQVSPGTRLAQIIGAGTKTVNSRHHQAIGRVGDGLRVSAQATDGIIEAVESPAHRFVVAVQWHPEDRYMVSEADRLLFQAFAAEIA